MRTWLPEKFPVKPINGAAETPNHKLTGAVCNFFFLMRVLTVCGQVRGIRDECRARSISDKLNNQWIGSARRQFWECLCDDRWKAYGKHQCADNIDHGDCDVFWRGVEVEVEKWILVQRHPSSIPEVPSLKVFQQRLLPRLMFTTYILEFEPFLVWQFPNQLLANGGSQRSCGCGEISFPALFFARKLY